MTDEQIQAVLERHANELAELFDAVQILTSGVDETGRTFRQYCGSGNYFARTGMCHDFIGQEAATQIANKLGPLDDE